MKSFIVFIIFFSSAFSMQASSHFNEMSDRASQLYSEGKYAEALEVWYDLTSSGNTDPNLFFNIGSAESLLNHVPESILAFEKAARLKPGDLKIKEAIKKERTKIDDAVIPVSPFFLIEWYHQFLAIFRPGGWVLIGLLCITISILQWLVSVQAMRKFGLINGKKNWYFLVAGFLFVLTGVLTFHQINKNDEGIVMLTCDCRQAASVESPVMRVLSPGEKVKISDHLSEWYKVSLLNLDEGWIQKECLQPIMIGSN